ncbi:17525_t:CDS:2 [Entrophospora sp. SA101]|nr:17525_t:CDS:2 [Entrophospora sp. SA101]
METEGNTEEIEILEELSNGERHKRRLRISVPINTANLKDKVIKALYNSLINYWSMQTSALGYLASALDPRFKDLRFAPE